MNKIAWWGWGIVGGLSLSLATVEKIIHATLVEPLKELPKETLLMFAVSLFFVGFFCGAAVYALLGLSKRYGPLGDILIGMITMPVFFFLCAPTFDPAPVSSKAPAVESLPLYLAAVVLGGLLGYFLGRDLRKLAASRSRKSR